MKTAEEWQQHWHSITQHWIAQECRDKEDYVNNFVSVLKEVQLDAFKAGMRRAAEVADMDNNWPKSKAILDAAEKLTEKDL